MHACFIKDLYDEVLKIEWSIPYVTFTTTDSLSISASEGDFGTKWDFKSSKWRSLQTLTTLMNSAFPDIVDYTWAKCFYEGIVLEHTWSIITTTLLQASHDLLGELLLGLKSYTNC